MNSQMKRGLIDICVLAIVREKASYGYQISKEIQPYMKISESTLYPTLKRLEKSGLLSAEQKVYNGRIRKYYTITNAGILRITEFKREWEDIMGIYNFISEKVTYPKE